MNENIKIGCIVVTYNRLNKLKTALRSYEGQSVSPSVVVVVNNASTDGTDEYLREWGQKTQSFEKEIIKLDENTGGSGGFYAGMKFLLQKDIDWILVNDDDAYLADSHVFENFRSAVVECEEKGERVAAICGVADEKKGIKIAAACRIKEKKLFGTVPCFKTISIPDDAFKERSLSVDLIVYVGTFFNVKALRKYGVTEKGMFIHGDDWEHSLRLRKYGRLYCYPSIKFIHDTSNGSPANRSWIVYYDIRNNIFMRKKNQFPYIMFSFMRCVVALKDLLKGDFSMFKLRVTAVKDGVNGNMGKHDIYKPGWKKQKNL